MMTKFLIILSLCTCNIANCQDVKYVTDYAGQAGDVISDSISVKPGELYLIEYCTHFVPDKLIVYNDESDSLVFYIGSELINEPSNDQYHGYCEFKYDDINGLKVILSDTSYWPPALTCGVNRNIGGIMRLYYIPGEQCNLKFIVRGNLKSYTIYSLVITQLTHNFVDDTIVRPVCQSNLHPFYFIDECHQSYVIPVDWHIDDDPIITNIDCTRNLQLGSVEFEKYPEFNRYDLQSGSHTIEISNEHCVKSFNIDINANPCNLYIPNVFSPNDDDDNDQFTIFGDIDGRYDLTIYDRWGNLLYHGTHDLNYGGWNGSTNDFKVCQPGVYVYKMKIVDYIYSGSITLIK